VGITLAASTGAGVEEVVMAVLMTQDLPVGREDVEAVTAEMQVKQRLPAGLILHTFTVTPQGVHVVDVWESTAHYDKFRDERLMPAMAKVMAERGIQMDGLPPAPEFSEAFDVITGQ
jgi:hypothetical protein